MAVNPISPDCPDEFLIAKSGATLSGVADTEKSLWDILEQPKHTFISCGA